MSSPILFLGSQMTVGGAQHVLLAQAQWFHDKGYPVTAAFFYDKENLGARWNTRYDFSIINLNARRTGANIITNIALLLRGLMRLWHLLRRERFSVVETFTPHSNLLGLPLAWMAGVPVRIGSHHGRIENEPRWLEWLHGRMIDGGAANVLVTVSSRVSRLAIDGEGIKPERVKMIPNGVSIPPQEMFPKNNVTKTRQNLGVAEYAHLLISVGRLTSQKGHGYMLAAFPQVLAHLPKTVLALVGDGPRREELEQQARASKIEAGVRFLGTRDDVYRLLSAADVFVLPSVSEGMPMSLLEAMGMGVPVVASHLEGIADVVENGQHGLLVPPGEVKLLAEAIIRLLENDGLRKRLAQSAQQLVREAYTLDRMCEQYEELFFETYQENPV
ncbi:MAG: glycosyltransferase [Chloroflexota bacterium]|nr:glycosyltransferase [Chloroflexota bacterium]